MEAASSEKEVWELHFRDLPGASDLTSHCSRTSLAAVLGNLPNTLPAPGPLHLLFFLPQMLFPGHPCGCLAHVIQTSLDVSPHPMSRLRFRLTPHLKQHPHYILSPEPVSFSFLPAVTRVNAFIIHSPHEDVSSAEAGSFVSDHAAVLAPGAVRGPRPDGLAKARQRSQCSEGGEREPRRPLRSGVGGQ